MQNSHKLQCETAGGLFKICAEVRLTKTCLRIIIIPAAKSYTPWSCEILQWPRQIILILKFHKSCLPTSKYSVCPEFLCDHSRRDNFLAPCKMPFISGNLHTPTVKRPLRIEQSPQQALCEPAQSSCKRTTHKRTCVRTAHMKRSAKNKHLMNTRRLLLPL